MSTVSITPLDHISEDLFEVLGLHDVPEEEKASLLLHMVEVVQDRVFDRIYDLLNTNQRDQFATLLEKEDVVEVERFLGENVSNYTDLFDSEAKALRLQLIQKFA